jgi:hypothetical protein
MAILPSQYSDQTLLTQNYPELAILGFHLDFLTSFFLFLVVTLALKKNIGWSENQALKYLYYL